MQLPAISGATKLTGLLGYPVAHSLSPRLQHYWLAQHKINARYLAFEVSPTHLAQAITGAAALGIKGLNVTVPHKEAAFALIEKRDAAAQKIGAINCIMFDAQGTPHGTNTDAYGFIENLREQVPNLAPYLSHVVVLGAGGATRAIIAALQEAGTKKISLVNRTITNAEIIAQQMGGSIACVTWAEVNAVLPQATMLINATSLGMAGHSPLNISLAALPAEALVHDIIYNPLETTFLRAAKLRGNPVADGLGMLMYQAQKSFALWHGITPEITPELKQLLQQKL